MRWTLFSALPFDHFWKVNSQRWDIFLTRVLGWLGIHTHVNDSQMLQQIYDSPGGSKWQLKQSGFVLLDILVTSLKLLESSFLSFFPYNTYRLSWGTSLETSFINLPSTHEACAKKIFLYTYNVEAREEIEHRMDQDVAEQNESEKEKG